MIYFNLCLLKIILSSPLHMWIDWYITLILELQKKYFQDLQKRTYGMENLLGGCFVVEVSWGNFVNWNSNFWIHLSTRKRWKHKEKEYLVVIPEMTDLDMFFHVDMVKVLSHPAHITPVKIPFTFPVSQSFIVLLIF